MATQKFNITGMTCAACSAHVEKAVKEVKGTSNVSVNLLTNSLLTDIDTEALVPQIISAVEKAGYGASVVGGDKKETTTDSLEDTQTPKLLKRFIWSLILLLPLMYVSMGYVMFNWPVPSFLSDNPMNVALYELFMTSIIMLINRQFFISGFKSALHLSANMDTLVALGSSVSYLYSIAIIFVISDALLNNDLMMAHHQLHSLYFESAAMILTLITIGKTLEAYSKGKTTNAIKALLAIVPKTATLVKDGQLVTVDIDEVRTDDVYLVKPGERIPVDGMILEGNSAVDESALTGESLPIDKTVGEKVSAGTINQNGALTCKATHVGKDTTLNQIIEMVENAASTKAPIAKIADKVSGVFVPCVIAIALVTGIIWLLLGKDIGYVLTRSVSVLVISCPCALGLATPVAIMVGSGVGAKQGILFKTASSLEATGKANYVVLDKTGTITQGKPQVTDIYPYGINEDQLLTYAYALEHNSEHPLAHAIVEKAQVNKAELLKVDNFISLPGAGVSASINNQELLGGNQKLISKSITLNEESKELCNTLANQGKTPLLFSLDHKLIGIIAVADTIKEDSVQAIKELKMMGITPIMLTGDNKQTAQAISKQVGVDYVISNVMPKDKQDVVDKLLAYGKVIMVGDGINDAPALTKADVGIAIGAGSDIAIEAGDVVLMKSSLLDVSGAIQLSKKVIRNIHENLFWAFIYNCIGIPLAAGLLIPFGLELNPMFGAAAMSLSSFCVVTNALRLNGVKLHTSSFNKTTTSTIPEFLLNTTKEENLMEKTISIEGMMCEHCVAHVKKALEGISGVNSVNVSLDDKNAVIESANPIEDATINKAIEEAGYKVTGIK